MIHTTNMTNMSVAPIITCSIDFLSYRNVYIIGMTHVIGAYIRLGQINEAQLNLAQFSWLM